jgi:hypothetical protein
MWGYLFGKKIILYMARGETIVLQSAHLSLQGENMDQGKLAVKKGSF